MKTWTAPAFAAFALVSLTTALARPPAGALQRRTDAPPLPPCPPNNYKPYTYVGCFKEDSPRSLQYNPNLVFSTMTVETCTATCKVSIKRYTPFRAQVVDVQNDLNSPMDSNTLA
jgi:hypothetical protein